MIHYILEKRKEVRDAHVRAFKEKAPILITKLRKDEKKSRELIANNKRLSRKVAHYNNFQMTGACIVFGISSSGTGMRSRLIEWMDENGIEQLDVDTPLTECKVGDGSGASTNTRGGASRGGGEVE